MLVTFAPTFDKANSTYERRRKKNKGESTQNALLPHWGMPQQAVTLHNCIRIPSVAFFRKLPLQHLYRVWQIIKRKILTLPKKKQEEKMIFTGELESA